MKKQIEAPVFEIQRFSIHDGPGIRTLVFFKGCLLNCKWCQNPESQDKNPTIAFYQDRCKESFSCKKVCPENAIQSDGFRIDYDKCTACGECVTACAYGAVRTIGNIMTPGELLTQILADQPYYQKSGGGVTFSGGEPTLYPEFLDEVLDLCRENNIHTTIETCGCFSFNKWEHILKKSDLIYFDLKIMDEQGHDQATGVPNNAILENAKMLAGENFPIEFRMPMIPTYTDTEKNIDEAIGFLKQLGMRKIHLLKYHNMGEAKIDIIQGDQEKLNLSTYSTQRFDEIKASFSKAGIEICN
ncbi:MAG: glycyl-radical enzyme activating protein [Bacteroidetes bacterium]|nr:glycyl-radical enzyme activating protein [Bacteroidota bacterium]